ncbi:Sugar transport protein 6 [Sesamum alatum]|uniref:Sugar transport protein 6 n=1 Tax=Sesamum alatum TaxID=300844 RepID=A0AAE1YG33_9LAMI|nr:Sugar transport protein 6 [Sesamum alatum]
MVFEWPKTLGTILAATVNYVASYFHIWGWRMSLGGGGIPTFLLLLVSFTLIETPQFFIEQDHLERAKKILQSLRGSNTEVEFTGSDIELEFTELVVDTKKKQTMEALREIIRPCNRPILVISSIETVFGKLSGGDLFIFYGPFLLQSIGYERHWSFLAALVVAFVDTIAKGVSPLLIRRIGRRRVYLVAYLTAIIPLVCVGSLFHLNLNTHHHFIPHRATTTIVFVLLHIIGSGVISGPDGWLHSTFPPECEDLASAYKICLERLTTFTVNQIFFHVLCAVREWTFFLYAGLCLAMMLFNVWFIPETTGIAQHAIARRVWSQHWFWK